MKKVIIAGGAGFIGFHLTRRLLQQGCAVICVDNLSTGDAYHVENLSRYPHFFFYPHDITFPFDIEADVIYNLACPASPLHYQKDPLHTLDTNYLGTKHLLNLAHKYKAVFFQASTSEVYGDPLEHPQKESYLGNVNTMGLRACYDEGKRVAETLCFEYARKFDVHIHVARIFNTYGPRMRFDDGRVVSNFICQALENKPLTIYGNGHQTRSFCYIEDLLDAIELMMQQRVYCPINLGNPEEFSILELARKILVFTKSSSWMQFLPVDKDDPKVRSPDITQATHVLGWKPKIHIDQGLMWTIENFKQRKGLSK